ncbi:hypothetical protein Btru_038386 [Bulinus truncatus]|nr:hypothetical protein Btru_038386 [Bulinus truncatus]
MGRDACEKGIDMTDMWEFGEGLGGGNKEQTINKQKLEHDPLNKQDSRYIEQQQQIIEHLKTQRDLLSRLLNEMKQTYGQQNCEMMIIKNQGNTDVSANGGWCARASSPNSTTHATDKSLATALMKSYTSYDGAPFCETVTGGLVKFLDLTAPQFGLPIFDWAISLEVAEHIPAKYEDIYLDNLVRHAREGIILSWAVPGQGGLSHVNNKALTDVIQVMSKRGFNINITAGEPMRKASQYVWLQNNVHVYYRNITHSLIEIDA